MRAAVVDSLSIVAVWFPVKAHKFYRLIEEVIDRVGM
jgi:hypothetical protein